MVARCAAVARLQRCRRRVRRRGRQARLTLTWEVAQVCFTAAEQVAMVASEVRESHGVGAVLAEAVNPRLSHGAPDDAGPPPVAVVTFDAPKTVQAIPGWHRSGDLHTGYLYLLVTDWSGEGVQRITSCGSRVGGRRS